MEASTTTTSLPQQLKTVPVFADLSDEDLAWLADTCTPFGLGPKNEWKKVRSAGKLWRYDKKEFAVWKEAL